METKTATVAIRGAAIEDAEQIGRLVTELGYATTTEAMRARLAMILVDRDVPAATQEPRMTSRVELDINARQPQLAELFADPHNNPRWMDDIERIEPISGNLGELGSVYRLVPKRGSMVFVATVVTKALPTELRLSLDAGSVLVSVTDTFLRLSDNKTKLISEEVFTFKGVSSKAIGFIARRSITRAHRRHMESFKRFAESHTS